MRLARRRRLAADRWRGGVPQPGRAGAAAGVVVVFPGSQGDGSSSRADKEDDTGAVSESADTFDSSSFKLPSSLREADDGRFDDPDGRA